HLKLLGCDGPHFREDRVAGMDGDRNRDQGVRKGLIPGVVTDRRRPVGEDVTNDLRSHLLDRGASSAVEPRPDVDIVGDPRTRHAGARTVARGHRRLNECPSNGGELFPRDGIPGPEFVEARLPMVGNYGNRTQCQRDSGRRRPGAMQAERGPGDYLEPLFQEPAPGGAQADLDDGLRTGVERKAGAPVESAWSPRAAELYGPDAGTGPARHDYRRDRPADAAGAREHGRGPGQRGSVRRMLIGERVCRERRAPGEHDRPRQRASELHRFMYGPGPAGMSHEPPPAERRAD